MRWLISLSTLYLLSSAIAAACAGDASQAGKKLKIVVFSAHPADSESGVGGLAATLAEQGHEVIFAVASAFRGERKIDGKPEVGIRTEEEAAACKLLGMTSKIFPYDHNLLVSDLETQKVVRTWLEEVKPDIVITHWPIDTHENHSAVYGLVWRCYKQSKGGWNLYLYEIETGGETPRLPATTLLRYRTGSGPQEAGYRPLQEPGAREDLEVQRADATQPGRRVRRAGCRSLLTRRSQEGMPATAGQVSAEESHRDLVGTTSLNATGYHIPWTR